MSAVVCLINGRAGDQVPVRDRGFQYGDGLFETIAVCAGRPLLWERHMQRLSRDAARLGIAAPPEPLWRAEAHGLCRGVARGVLKLVLTRGGSERGYAPAEAEPTRVVSLAPWPDQPPAHAQDGVDVRLCRTTLACHPRLAGIKHLNRLEQVLARGEWKDGYAEGLMLDEDGHVIEGTMSNLFLVQRGALLTPDLSRCGVAGVVRDLVLEKARALALPVHVTTLTPADLLTADEIFLTNSLIGLWPVKRFENRDYPVGKVTHSIRDAIGDAVCPAARC